VALPGEQPHTARPLTLELNRRGAPPLLIAAKQSLYFARST
jgi:hypothetical protein